MESLEISNNECQRRRSRKVKNLQEEVDLILSQDESDDMPERKLPQTPTTSAAGQQLKCNNLTPKASEMAALKDATQTPRRSCRKSIKPPLDYDDIVTRSLRSVGKSAKKSLRSFVEEENEENMESLLVEEEDDAIQQKWYASIVGSSSTKRGRKRGRKSKKEKEEEENHHMLNGAVRSPISSKEVIFSDKPKVGGGTDDKDFKRDVEVRIIPEIIIHSPEKESEIFKDLEKNDSTEILEQNPKENMEIHTVYVEVNEIMTVEETKVDPLVQDKSSEDEHLLKDNIHIEDEEPFEKLNDKNRSIDKNIEEKLKEEFSDKEYNVQFILDESEDVRTTDRSKLDLNEDLLNRDDNESQKDKFGSFLKSNKINVTDLGLIPLKDEDDTEEMGGDIKTMEEMPSLIVLDDEEEEQPIEETSKPKLNVTFETITEFSSVQRTSFASKEACNDSLHIFLQNEAATKDEDMEPVEMCSLKISDDESTPSKVPRNKKTLITTPKSMGTPSTPKQKIKPYRFPTPHSNKFQGREPTSSSKKLPSHHNMNSALTSLEPKEIVLRGIRKRSLSMSVVGFDAKVVNASKQQSRALKGPLATHRQQKVVNFHSPANQTTIIDDLDQKIAESVRKDKINKPTLENSYVTTRRKRSLSLDESMMSKALISKIPRLGVKTSNFATAATSSNANTKVSRTKLPNFSAIHQKHFQQMENLIDHVQRKQERSKLLINSATKIKPVSAQKTITLNKNLKSNIPEKPKALKKIDLDPKSIKINSTVATTVTCSVPKENDASVKESKLPHPRDLCDPKMIQIINKNQKYLFEKKHLKPTQTSNVLANTSKVIKTQQSQKPFNLSTQIASAARPVIVKPILTKSSNIPSTSSSSSLSASTSKPTLSTQDKMASRLQRHMDLFKGRNPATRSGVAARKMEANIKGVRSNRRFELQMKHRKNLEN